MSHQYRDKSWSHLSESVVVVRRVYPGVLIPCDVENVFVVRKWCFQDPPPPLQAPPTAKGNSIQNNTESLAKQTVPLKYSLWRVGAACWFPLTHCYWWRLTGAIVCHAVTLQRAHRHRATISSISDVSYMICRRNSRRPVAAIIADRLLPPAYLNLGPRTCVWLPGDGIVPSLFPRLPPGFHGDPCETGAEIC